MLEYKLRENPRARRINITVRRNGEVWVTKPRRVPMRQVETFIHKCEAWILRAQEKCSAIPKTSRVESSKKEYEKYKSWAKGEIARRVTQLNAGYKFRFTKIAVRNQKSRWGSCTREGTLSFNYRILFLPDHLADYIVVHELCHLREMNHSKKFWDLVALTVPDHRECRKQLRKLERSLLS